MKIIYVFDCISRTTLTLNYLKNYKTIKTIN